MWSQYVVVACLSVLVSGLAGSTYECPPEVSSNPDVKIFGQNCYEFVVYRRKHFYDAQNYCQDNGGNLAIIKSRKTNNFIGKTLQHNYNVYYGSVWIGLEYIPEDGFYKWVDGSDLWENDFELLKNKAYTPSNENCVAMDLKTRVWRDYACPTLYSNGERKMFVCQYPAIPITTTIAPTTKKPHQGAITVDDCPKVILRDEYLQVYGRKCYMFEVKQRKSFFEADKECQRGGGRLVTVDSHDIDTYIQDELYYTYGRLFPAWIGLHYSKFHRIHHWLDGSIYRYGNFRYKTFLTSNRCVAISAVDGKWLAKNCNTNRLPYVCEFEPIQHPLLQSTVATPSTTMVTKSTALNPGHKTNIHNNPRITKENCPVQPENEKNLQVLDHQCYVFYLDVENTFQEAENFCESLGGTLALVKTQDVHLFLHHHISHTHKKSLFDNFWIGLRYRHDKIPPGFYWVDGTPWNRYIPIFQFDGDCVVLNAFSGWLTNSRCDEKGFSVTKGKLGFICEFESKTQSAQSQSTPATVTETTTEIKTPFTTTTAVPKLTKTSETTTTTTTTTTTAKPTTTTTTPTTTTAKPTTTTTIPTTTTAKPTTTTTIPTTTTATPTTTTIIPTKTTAKPTTTTTTPTTTTAKPTTTITIPTKTTAKPSTTTIPTKTTAKPSTTTTIPTKTTAKPSTTTTISTKTMAKPTTTTTISTTTTAKPTNTTTTPTTTTAKPTNTTTTPTTTPAKPTNTTTTPTTTPAKPTTTITIPTTTTAKPTTTTTIPTTATAKPTTTTTIPTTTTAKPTTTATIPTTTTAKSTTTTTIPTTTTAKPTNTTTTPTTTPAKPTTTITIPTTTTAKPTTTITIPTITTAKPTNTTTTPTTTTAKPTTTTTIPTTTTAKPTNTTTTPTTTPAKPTNTTTTPTTTPAKPTTTITKSKTTTTITHNSTSIRSTLPPKTICPSLTCELGCGLLGYKQDANGCAICECDV